MEITLGSKIELGAIIFLAISLIVCIGVIIWTLKIKRKQEEQLLQFQQASLLEASTVYNESPVKWIKQTKIMEHYQFKYYITQNTDNPLNVYLLESHQITQRLILDFCQKNNINLFCFKNIEHMADFYNKESEKSELEIPYMPNLIIASDRDGGAKLLEICRDNQDLSKISFIMISQNPNIHRDTLGTIVKPLEINKMESLLRFWLNKANQRQSENQNE